MNATLIHAVLGTALIGLGAALWHARRAATEAEVHATALARKNAELNYEMKQTRAAAEETRRQAVELDTRLGSAKVRNMASETKLAKLDQREADLRLEVATLRRQMAGGPPAEEAVLRSRLAEREQQLLDLLTRALGTPGTVSGVPAVPPGAPRVVRVGPGDAFVVTDHGTRQGARPGQIFPVRRGTLEVARVQVSDARDRFSIAQVLPGSLKGQLQPGDIVVLPP